MQLFSNLTALAATATTVNILDFSKQNAIDLSNGQENCAPFTAVQSWPYINNGNQMWTLIGGPDTYQIQSPECGLYLTYAGGAIPTFSPLTGHPTLVTSWIISLVNPSVPTGPWNILYANQTDDALTAWDMSAQNSDTSAPIVLEDLNAKDTRQQFWFAV